MRRAKAKPERTGAKRSKTVPVVELYGVPEFKNEAEEADWWDAHPEVVTKAFEQAYGKGVVDQILNRRSAGKSVHLRLRPATKSVNIRLPVADIALARQLAARKGLAYQALVKSLLHEALRREARS